MDIIIITLLPSDQEYKFYYIHNRIASVHKCRTRTADIIVTIYREIERVIG